jgi:UDP-N-acetylglucosamine:LPS N-acetylglucosamine transferase
MTGTPIAPPILVLTASMGAGHLHAADELARRLAVRGIGARVVDVL